MIKLTATSISSNGSFSIDGNADNWEDIDQLVRRAYSMRTNITRINIGLDAFSKMISIEGIFVNNSGIEQLLNGNLALVAEQLRPSLA